MNSQSRAAITFLFLAAALFVAAPAHADIFTRNLILGTKGEDVRMLQKILNLSPETRVASSGAGSPGQETATFGPATKVALLKFQNLYAKDILAPLGLIKAPGYAGTYTIRKLRSFLPLVGLGITLAPDPAKMEAPAEIETRPVITAITVSPTTPLTSGVPAKTSKGIVVFENLNTLILTGKNFTKLNSIIISNEPVIPNLASTDGASLTFTFSSALAAEIARSVVSLPNPAKDIVIDHIVTAHGGSLSDPALTGGWYVPISIWVRNEHGMSEPISAVVNLRKGL